MQTVRDPFGKALCAIRSSLRGGRWVLGERLAISALSLELNLSATPVREALARLAGEGLIEERRGQGYFAWRLDTIDLVELYELQTIYLLAALDRARDGAMASSPQADPEERSAAGAAEAVFVRLVRLGASSALNRAHGLLADRLAAPRLAEALVLDDPAAELAQIESCDEPTILRGLLEAYGRRRIDSAAQIVAALRSQVAGPC